MRAKCKVHLTRLGQTQRGVDSGLSIEVVDKENGILELKIKWDKQEFRFLFYRAGGDIFIVNFFQKKTRKTPPSEINLAIQRKRDIGLDQANIVDGIH